MSEENKIVRQVELKAPVSRVWKALTDHRQFGEWFRVELEGPFVKGKVARGRILHPGCDHLTWEATITEIRPETYFAFTWHPYGVDPEKYDYSKETPTLIEFTLEKRGQGTLLTLTESGFENIPKDRMPEAFRMNSQGWTIQMKNIEAYVTERSSA